MVIAASALPATLRLTRAAINALKDAGKLFDIGSELLWDARTLEWVTVEEVA